MGVCGDDEAHALPMYDGRRDGAGFVGRNGGLWALADYRSALVLPGHPRIFNDPRFRLSPGPQCIIEHLLLTRDPSTRLWTSLSRIRLSYTPRLSNAPPAIQSCNVAPSGFDSTLPARSCSTLFVFNELYDPNLIARCCIQVLMLRYLKPKASDRQHRLS